MSHCQEGSQEALLRHFDRVDSNKLHLQSLCAIAHSDCNMTDVYGYEQALMIMRRVKLSKKEQLQPYRHGV